MEELPSRSFDAGLPYDIQMMRPIAASDPSLPIPDEDLQPATHDDAQQEGGAKRYHNKPVNHGRSPQRSKRLRRFGLVRPNLSGTTGCGIS
jgi:hypothetical protein